MPKHPFPHALTLLRAIADDPPPLAPLPVLETARTAYGRFLRMPPADAREIEDVTVACGRILWPYRKAFEALVRNELIAEPALPRQILSAERAAVCRQMMAARTRAEETVQAVIISNDREYRKLVKEFQAIQHEIEAQIAALRRVADRAADHPDVAAEIMETVRLFEHGLAQLAREPETRDVCVAVERYRARHEYVREKRLIEGRPKIFG